jgi:SAM-dependent methyltransferase
MKRLIKKVLPPFVISFYSLLKSIRPIRKRSCNICGNYGYFGCFGCPPRIDAMCMKCGSLERHRLFWTWFKGDVKNLQEPILHFAPEPILEKNFRKIFGRYQTADLYAKADLKLNIEDIALESGCMSTIICNHVLEHVQDKKALQELFRVLKQNGRLICSVPIIEGWELTYENSHIKTANDKEAHFGQYDHVRYYGRDFRDRLSEAGFLKVEEVTAEGLSVVEFGLLRGEKIFICSKQ